MRPLHEGLRINNFLLEARIGGGTFGEVWRAKHHVFDDRVAIKIPTDVEYVRYLQREGVAMHGLAHPNIIRAIDLDPYADPPYLIMEYVDGPSVRRVIETTGAKLPFGAVVTILRGVLTALTAAHTRGIVHRDIKPENVLLTCRLEDVARVRESNVKVTDFGLGSGSMWSMQSVQQSVSLASRDGRGFSGTLAYMSPEQREGQPVDGRSDLYACGVMLFELLTGERPYGTETPGMMRGDVPEALDVVFRRAYARLDRRYASAVQMYEALAAVAGPPAVPTGCRTEGHAAGMRNQQPRVGRSRLPHAPPACPRCREAVQSGDNFCIHCGQQLAPSVPRCAACSAYVDIEDRYCMMCGASLPLMA